MLARCRRVVEKSSHVFVPFKNHSTEYQKPLSNCGVHIRKLQLTGYGTSLACQKHIVSSHSSSFKCQSISWACRHQIAKSSAARACRQQDDTSLHLSLPVKAAYGMCLAGIVRYLAGVWQVIASPRQVMAGVWQVMAGHGRCTAGHGRSWQVMAGV